MEGGPNRNDSEITLEDIFNDMRTLTIKDKFIEQEFKVEDVLLLKDEDVTRKCKEFGVSGAVAEVLIRRIRDLKEKKTKSLNQGKNSSFWISKLIYQILQRNDILF